MSDDWENAVDAASLTKDDVRARLSLEYVVNQELSVTFDEDGNANCPFHDDARPSFAIFENDDGVERVGCWSCDWRGDVFDVIMTARAVHFGVAIDLAKSFLLGLGDEIPERTRRERPVLDPTVLAAEVGVAIGRTQTGLSTLPEILGPISDLLVKRGLRMDANFLFSRYLVSVASNVGAGAVMIPHFDDLGGLTGYKVRSSGGPPIARAGSRFSHLYGTHLLTPEFKPIVLTEGESDTWTVDWLFGDDYFVLGLPTGANSPLRADWLRLMDGRDVIIAFDGDDAGRMAAGRWEVGLKPHVRTARVAPFADGEDCTSVMPSRLADVLA